MQEEDIATINVTRPRSLVGQRVVVTVSLQINNAIRPLTINSLQ